MTKYVTYGNAKIYHKYLPYNNDLLYSKLSISQNNNIMYSLCYRNTWSGKYGNDTIWHTFYHMTMICYKVTLPYHIIMIYDTYYVTVWLNILYMIMLPYNINT